LQTEKFTKLGVTIVDRSFCGQ